MNLDNAPILGPASSRMSFSFHRFHEAISGRFLPGKPIEFHRVDEGTGTDIYIHERAHESLVHFTSLGVLAFECGTIVNYGVNHPEFARSKQFLDCYIETCAWCQEGAATSLELLSKYGPPFLASLDDSAPDWQQKLLPSYARAVRKLMATVRKVLARMKELAGEQRLTPAIAQMEGRLLNLHPLNPDDRKLISAVIHGVAVAVMSPPLNPFPTAAETIKHALLKLETIVPRYDDIAKIEVSPVAAAINSLIASQPFEQEVGKLVSPIAAAFSSAAKLDYSPPSQHYLPQDPDRLILLR
jgi:hypothetical protein